ncbi:hypothetical protein CFOL_v3_34853, partial [Cephalotus follicularis]
SLHAIAESEHEFKPENSWFIWPKLSNILQDSRHFLKKRFMHSPTCKNWQISSPWPTPHPSSILLFSSRSLSREQEEKGELACLLLLHTNADPAFDPEPRGTSPR